MKLPRSARSLFLALGTAVVTVAAVGFIIWGLAVVAECYIESAMRVADAKRQVRAVTILEDVALYLSKCGPNCNLVAARIALGDKYRTAVSADSQVLFVEMISIAFGDHGVKYVREEPHSL